MPSQTLSLEEIEKIAARRLKEEILNTPKPKIVIPLKGKPAPGRTRITGLNDSTGAAKFVAGKVEDFVKHCGAEVLAQLEKDFPGIDFKFKVRGELRNSPAQFNVSAIAEKIKGEIKETTGKIVEETAENLQQKIDEIANKVKRKEKLSFSDKVFLKSFYEALVVGGKVSGFPEAAKLLENYIRKSGSTVEISSSLYTDSKRVEKEVKIQIKGAQSHAKMKKSAFPLKQVSRLILADYERLKKADNRFRLQSRTDKLGENLKIDFTVENVYDFKRFEEEDFFTDIPVPLTKGKKLKLPDGLSAHLHDIGMAKEFKYFAKWSIEVSIK